MAGFKHETVLFEDADLATVNSRLNTWLSENQSNIEVISSNLTTYEQAATHQPVFVIYLLFVRFNIED